MTLIVCPLSHVEAVVAARRPSHLITLLDPDHEIRTPEGLAPDRHLKVGVHDIPEAWEGWTCPAEDHVRNILEFGAGWDEAAPMLIHCWAGISRSTATAFILACERNPEVRERDIAFELRRASQWATPNRMFVSLADDMLGRGGRMVDAADSIGRGESAFESRPFDLPARYPRA